MASIHYEVRCQIAGEQIAATFDDEYAALDFAESVDAGQDFHIVKITRCKAHEVQLVG